jgi:hypothetical protein
MDNTSPRGYPYPQCSLPLVNDASDIIQLAALADAVDEDVQGLYDIASRNILIPDGVHIARTTNVTLNAGDFITFETARFDNTGLMAETDGIRLQVDGTYLVTFWIYITDNTDSLRGIVHLDGIGDRTLEGVGAGRGGFGTSVTGSVTFRSPAGRLYRLRAHTTGATHTIEQVEFCAVRIGDL